MILLLVPAAWALCFYDELDTTLEPLDAGVSRHDRWVVYVETGRAECARLPLADDGSTITDIEIRIRHPDERKRRPDGLERLEPKAPDEGELHPGSLLHLPELRFGDTLELEIVREYPDAALVWSPAAWGDVGRARLAWTSTLSPELLLPPSVPEPALEQRGRWTSVEFEAVTSSSEPLRAQIGRVPQADPPGPIDRGRSDSVVVHWKVLDDLTRSVEEQRTSVIAPGGVVVVPFPSEAEPTLCRATLDGVSATTVPLRRGCAYLHPADAMEGDLVIEAGWTIADPDLAGEIPVHRAEPMDVFRLFVEGSKSKVELRTPSVEGPTVVGARAWYEARDVAPETPEGIDHWVSWRITRHDDTPVLVDPAAALATVARRAVIVSIPEPALPVGMKRRDGDRAALDEVLEHLHDQVVPGSLPHQHPMLPRRLVEVRRSGWATAWESALLLTRYLRQLKLDAVPMPVRSLVHGTADPANPMAYADGAVVRVVLGGTPIWIDPSCLACAPGEIEPSLWGGATLDPDTAFLPPAPGGTHATKLTIGPTGEATMEVKLTGTAALKLRSRLLDVAIDGRPQALAGWFGGTEVRSITGLEPGADLVLEIAGIPTAEPTAFVLPLWSVATEGEDQVVLPVETSQLDVVADGAPCSAEGTRTVTLETLTFVRSIENTEAGCRLNERLDVTHPVAERGHVTSFVGDVGAARAALPFDPPRGPPPR